MSHLGQVVDNIELCVRRGRSLSVCVASRSQDGEREDSARMGSENISGQQRGQEHTARLWGGENCSPLEGHTKGKASQELYFQKSFLFFHLDMRELLPLSHSSSCVGAQFMSLLKAIKVCCGVGKDNGILATR